MRMKRLILRDWPAIRKLWSRSFHEKADPRQEFFLLFPYFLPFSSIFSLSAKPPLSPPFHAHSCVSDFRSVLVGCSRFSLLGRGARETS